MALTFDRVVERIVNGRVSGRCKVRELTFGDVFLVDGQQYELHKEEKFFVDCKTGYRIEYKGNWYIVLGQRGNNMAMYLEDPKDPFGNYLGTGGNDSLIHPDTKVGVMFFKKLDNGPALYVVS